jgi:GNAT superfamily N-acetyltransferase
MGSATIRATRTDEGEVLRDVERRAGQRFREVGMPDIADAEPFSVEALAAYALDGRSWVAVDEYDAPVGYVIVDVVDDRAHIEQMGIQPHGQGAGLGRALIAHVSAWTIEHGMHAVTLSTFSTVPWNQPLYEHLGFVVIDDDQIGPDLRVVQQREALHGLDPTQRVCLRLDLDADSGD